jgi:hypothetical protein
VKYTSNMLTTLRYDLSLILKGLNVRNSSRREIIQALDFVNVTSLHKGLQKLMSERAG